MADRNEHSAAAEQDRQIRRLAEQVRAQGTKPSRDLWPGIDQAISAAEERQLRPVARIGRVERWRPVAAAAAVAVLILGTAWWSTQRVPTTGPPAPMDNLTANLAEEPGRGPAGPTSADQLAVIDGALDEVTAALAADPENKSLTDLALMLHQSRGRALRQFADGRSFGS